MGYATPDSQDARIALGRSPDLCMILETPKGRGVFATSFISAGSIVETCPVLILSPKDAKMVSSTLLDSYTYTWPDPTNLKLRTQAVVLGLGSMFNHSVRGQNVGWTRKLDHQILVYTALRDVHAGEELCINYGKVWFMDTDDDHVSDNEDPEEILGNIRI